MKAETTSVDLVVPPSLTVLYQGAGGPVAREVERKKENVQDNHENGAKKCVQNENDEKVVEENINVDIKMGEEEACIKTEDVNEDIKTDAAMVGRENGKEDEVKMAEKKENGTMEEVQEDDIKKEELKKDTKEGEPVTDDQVVKSKDDDPSKSPLLPGDLPICPTFLVSHFCKCCLQFPKRTRMK